jgi:hypothetical protein
MSDINRTIETLLDDYAEALRDGCIATFLKSLTREEAKRMASSRQFQDATEVARILNGVAFADKAITSNVGLFISRVDAKIASRLKKSRASSSARRAAHPSPCGRGGARTRSATKTPKAEKPI